MKTTEIINKLETTFKSIEGHLRMIPIKEFNRAKKYALYLQYDIDGLFLGTTNYWAGGDITVKINDIKNKGDISRYVNLIREELEFNLLKEAI